MVDQVFPCVLEAVDLKADPDALPGVFAPVKLVDKAPKLVIQGNDRRAIFVLCTAFPRHNWAARYHQPDRGTHGAIVVFLPP
jgi:hypothetical protein